MLKEDLRNISSSDLLASGKISVRAYNCCGDVQFESLYDIISYYEQFHSFLKIRNVGRKTCEELESICKEIIPQIINLESPTAAKALIEDQDQDSFKGIQKELIQKKYSELLNCCTARTYNGLSNISADQFINSYLNCHTKEFFKIKNIGRKSVDEIIDFRAKFKSFIEEINYSKDSPLQIVRQEAKNIYGNIVDNDFVCDFFDKSSHFPMFWILEQYIKDDRTRGLSILIDSYAIFNNHQTLTLEKIALKHNLTRERVRQIRNGIFIKTFEITDEPTLHKNNSCFSYSQLLQNKNDWAYLLDLFNELDIVYHESFEIQNRLSEEKCNFSGEFVLQIIAYIFRDKFTLLGGIDISNRGRVWDKTFLVKKEYSDIFDFGRFREEFCSLIQDNEVDYLFDIEQYIANSQCWIKYDFNKTNSIICILRDILLYEFHLYSDDLEGHIRIPVNKERKPIDVVYEILRQSGRPMHLGQIFVEFKKILPEHKYSEASQLRPYLQRHEAITFINRKSVFSLKEWKHIRTGTIRDAIIEFLTEKEMPQSANDVTKYVLQFFSTNQKSVQSTMSSGKNFLQYKNGLFGLKRKKYPVQYEVEQQDELRKSFEQRLRELEIFIVEEGHFPFTCNVDSKEASLSRWWYRIINNKQQITDSQKTEIDRIKVQYAEYDTDKPTYLWFINYNKLKCFLLENRRIPSSRNDEKFLNSWLREANEDFQNFKLTEEQRQKYIALAKLI